MTSDDRYRRHLVLREVGPGGQERLAASAVAIQGSGRAAEEAAFYLVAAGVGRVILETPLRARHGERLAELNPDVDFPLSAVDALDVMPETEDRRADGANAALVALIALSGAADGVA